MKRLLLLAAAALVFALAPPQEIRAQSAADREAVRAAVLDYVEGVYENAPARIERSVHPDLVKRGFFVKKGETAYSPHTMTFAQLVELSKSYKTQKDAVKEVAVYDIADQTATAKLTAVWGIDYMHLAKYEGRWKIINILWQTPPKKDAASER